MNLKEGMHSIYRGEIPDKPVLGIYSRYLPRGEKERFIRNNGMGLIEYVPLTTQVGPPWHMLPGFLSEVKDTRLINEYLWEKGNIREKRTYLTPVGEVSTNIGQSKGAGSEHISAYYIKSASDYHTMKYIVENTILKSNEDLYLATVDRIGTDGVVLGRMDRTPYQKLMLEIVGSGQFLMDLFDNAEMVEELMYAMGKKYYEQVDRAMESSAEIIWLPDNVTVDMTPPRFYKEYLLKYYQYCCKCAHQTGKVVVAHYDGKLRPLIPLLNQTGIDVLESVSDPMIGGDMTYDECIEAFPDKVILPNFPSSLALASKEKVFEFIHGLLKKAEGKPLMLQISEDLPEGTWQDVIPLVISAMYN